MVEPPSVQPRSAAHRAVVHLDTPMVGDFQGDAADWAVHTLTCAIQSPPALPLPDDLAALTGPKSCYCLSKARILLAGRAKQQGERDDVRFADHPTKDCLLSLLPSCDAGQ
jgi:hypothetical protein